MTIPLCCVHSGRRWAATTTPWARSEPTKCVTSANPTRTTGWGRILSPARVCCAFTWSSSSLCVTAPASQTSLARVKRPSTCFTMSLMAIQPRTPAPSGERTPMSRWIPLPQMKVSLSWRQEGSTPKCAVLGRSPRLASTWHSKTSAPACLSFQSGFSSRSAPPLLLILLSSPKRQPERRRRLWWSHPGPVSPTPWKCPCLLSFTAMGTASGWFLWDRAHVWPLSNPRQTAHSVKVSVFNARLDFYLTKPPLYAQQKSPQSVPSSLHLLCGPGRGVKEGGGEYELMRCCSKEQHTNIVSRTEGRER